MPQSCEYELALTIIYDDDHSKRDDASAAPACWSRGKEVSLPHKTSWLNSVSCEKPAWKMNISGEGRKNKARHKHSRRSQAKNTGLQRAHQHCTADYKDRLVTEKKRVGQHMPFMSKQYAHSALFYECFWLVLHSHVKKSWLRLIVQNSKGKKVCVKRKASGKCWRSAFLHDKMPKLQWRKNNNSQNKTKQTTGTGCDGRTANYQSGPIIHPM